MRYQELHDTLRKLPFEPFRIKLTTGDAFSIGNPDFAALTRSSILIFTSSQDDEIPDRFSQYDLLHVVGIEPLGEIKHAGGNRNKN